MACLVCKSKTDGSSLTCGFDDCLIEEKSMCTDDVVTTMYAASPDICDLLFGFANHSIQSPNSSWLFEPCPNGFNVDEIKKKMNDENMRTLAKLKTDKLIYKKSPALYATMKFTLTGIRGRLCPSTFVTKEEIEKYAPGAKVSIYDVFYSEEWTDSCSFLFHGSGSDRWYPILMNGLKSCSGTKLQKNGQAYGQGIYFSDSSALSAQYSSNGAIGVFQIKGAVGKYQKSRSDIYVVPDESIVRLKYLFVASSSNRANLQKLLNAKFVINRANVSKSRKKVGRTIGNRRLLKEVEKIPKLNEENNGLTIKLDDNMSLWKCYITDVDKDSELANDMKKAKIETIELEITFPPTFPMVPPFVRIVRPIFMFMTGHITSGGSVCMELLTDNGWAPSYSIENLLVQIRSLIVEGNGRLDLSKKGEHYGLSDAKLAFERMKNAHKW